MPGVKTGDMGPKFGYHGKDNGWMTLNKVRVPRSQLLQRFIAVDREGSVSIEGDMRALYTTMMYVRYVLLYTTKVILAQALQIAIRYSLVRRQFKNISGQKEETKLLDYQTQQMKLFPVLSIMYAHSYSAWKVQVLLDQMLEDSANKKFDLIDIMHHYTSGMKSVFT